MKKLTLKERNLPMIFTYLIINIVIGYVILVYDSVDLDLLDDTYKKLSAKDGFFIAIIPFLSLILTNFISSDTKARIIFLRLKNPLPGSRAFSHHAIKETRMDLDNLKSKYSPFPTSPIEQNRLWYRIYKKNESNIIVNKSQKQFLLTRELAIISLFLCIIYPLLVLSFGSYFAFSLKFQLYLILLSITMIIVCRNLGIRFTRNVIVIESQKVNNE